MIAVDPLRPRHLEVITSLARRVRCFVFASERVSDRISSLYTFRNERANEAQMHDTTRQQRTKHGQHEQMREQARTAGNTTLSRH